MHGAWVALYGGGGGYVWEYAGSSGRGRPATVAAWPVVPSPKCVTWWCVWCYVVLRGVVWCDPPTIVGGRVCHMPPRA